MGTFRFSLASLFFVMGAATRVLAQNLTSGLVAYYTFENSVTDQSGSGNHASVSGTYQFLPTGLSGGALRIIGDNALFYSGGGHVLLPSFGSYMNSGFSLSMWVRDEVLGGSPVNEENYVSFGALDLPKSEIILNSVTRIVRFNIDGGQPGAFREISKTLNSSDFGTWKHLTLTYSPGRFAAYFNGTKLGEATANYNVFPVSKAALGRHWWNGGASSSARMSVTYDNVRIYNRALSDTEVQQVFVLESTASAPVITAISSPRQIVNLGQSLALSVTATSSSTLNYQWKRNGLPISGATSLVYTITNAMPVRDAGWYQATVTNSSGASTSAVVFVNVAVSPAQFVVWGDNTAGQTAVPPGLNNIGGLAGGSAHLLALKADGTVAAWGYGRNGETAIPGGLSNVVSLAAAGHSLALKADGTVAGWGYNANGQATVPGGLTNVVAIAAGGETSVALKADSTVVAWGRSSSGETAVPAGLTNVVGVAAGDSHGVALKSDGTVVAWGSNSRGQSAVPSGLTNVVSIAAGSSHTVALKSDGTVVTFGNPIAGEPAGLTNVVAIDAAGGGEHTLALKADGTVVGWGNHLAGVLTVPAGLSRVLGLAAGGNYSMVLRDAAVDLAPFISAQPNSQSATLGQKITFTVGASGGTATLSYQWRKDGVNIAGATSASYSVDPVVAGSSGNYSVIASNYLGTVSSTAASLTFTPLLSITSPPVNLTAVSGQSASFSVSAIGSPIPTYQWQKNGVNIMGATSATYAIVSPGASDAGTYTAVVTNSAGSMTSAAAILTVLESSRLANVSLRTTLANAQTLIVGFVVSGGAKDVLVRAAGPALAQFGLTTAMTDPRLELYKGATKVLENDNWPGALTGSFGSLGAFPFLPNSRDAALLENLNGGHSVLVTGTGSGLVLLETYDAGSGNEARLVNISARNRVGIDADILIAGFFIAGTGTKRVLVRAVGPTIGAAPFNVPGFLADPKLELFAANGTKIIENDNWDLSLAPMFVAVGAFALAPGGKDAALVVTLTAGSSYTVQVKGTDGGTGEALVEIYELP